MDRLKDTINTFNKYADQYQDKYMKYEPYVETYSYLSSLLPADAKILDVACGPGNIAKFLLEAKPELKIYGVDLSPKMVSLARLNNPSAAFDVMDSRDISTLNRTYDGIVAGFLFPYLSREEVDQFILDARAMIGTEGILYVSTMEGDYEASGYQSKNGIDRVYTYYHETKHLVEKLKAAGFEVIDVERKSFEREGEPKAVDVFIYARAC